MRNFILMLVSALLAISCASPEKDVVLTFNVDGPTASEVVLVCHKDILPLTLDSEGKAMAVLTEYDAAYARVFYGMDFKWIYFERGDRASVSFKGSDFAGTFVFEGEKAPAVDYLNRVTLTALPDEDYALPFDEYRRKIAEKADDALKLMKANSLGSAGNFEHMEEGRIRYSYGAPLLMHPMGHRIMTQDMSYMPDEDYYKAIDSYLVEDEDWVCLDEYREFAVEAAHVLDPKNREVTDMYPKSVAQMKFIADRFEDPDVRAVLLHHVAAPYVENVGINGIQEMENIYHTYVKDSVLLADYKEKYEKWDLSRPGKQSPDFSAADIDGKVWSLKDFRGKYVYVDMWATWCGPCKREVPYLKELAERFRDAEIVFLGLSTDRDKEKWEEAVGEGTLAGVQLYLGPQSTFQKAYNIDAIPRFILLDKEGRIVSNDMSRPSSPDTAGSLEALEGIRK